MWIRNIWKGLDLDLSLIRRTVTTMCGFISHPPRGCSWTSFSTPRSAMSRAKSRSRSTSEATSSGDRLGYWKNRWRDGQITFHSTEVNVMLKKYINKMLPDHKAGRVFVPLCGKSKDMKWLHDLGVPVVGVDGARLSLEQFFNESGFVEYQEEDVSQLGQDGKLLRSADGSIKLYCGDALKFDEHIEGTFEAVWDRLALAALQREDIPTYAKVIKKLMKPGSVCLLEIVDYDVKLFADLDVKPAVPPPFPMSEEEVKHLYEPECTVEKLDRGPYTLRGQNIHIEMLLITKTTH